MSYSRDEYKQRVVPLTKRFRDDKDDSVRDALRDALAKADFHGDITQVINTPQPEYSSMYGMTNWEENFADAFLAVCMGKTLPKGIQALMDSLT